MARLNKIKTISAAALIAVAFSSPALALNGNASEPDGLAVGKQAPALSVEKWVKGSSVASLEKGQVYVVEFWATWCPPCRASIPHLSEIQKKYGQDVTVIGVAGFERPKTDEARLSGLEKFVTDWDDKMQYTVAYDGDRSMAKDWMEAAGENGIPTAFVINAAGLISYIGGPREDGMEVALKKALAQADQPRVKKSKKAKVSVKKAGEAKKVDATKQAAVERPYELMVGDRAPGMFIAQWLKGEPVTEFQADHVYVVELWATWCGPCIRGIPHLTELQKKYNEENKKVTIIGVNIWEEDGLEKAPPFVESQGDRMNYTVAVQDGKKMENAWMKKAGQNGIPAAFIVDGKGRIAWIGHPSYAEANTSMITQDMGEAIDQILAGTYDIEKASGVYFKSTINQAKGEKILASMQSAAQAGEWDTVIEGFDKLFVLDLKQYGQFSASKFQILAANMQDYDKAYAWAREAAAGISSEDALVLNAIAYMILEHPQIEKRDNDLALELATKADKIAKHTDASIVDTIARAYFKTNQLDKAIEHQTEAVSLAEDEQLKTQLQKTLDEYLHAKGDG